MISLRDVQSGFLSAMLSGDNSLIAALIDAHGMSAEARLGIYRNNVLHNLIEALRDVYPVVERLVGEEFFAHAARHYIQGHPSTSGDIHRFGEHFAGFLEAFCSQLVYLGDTARLEWAWHEVFHAAEHPPLSLKRLAEVPPEDYASLRCSLHPACRLLSSLYPVHCIWQFNQPGHDTGETIDLAEGGVRLLIHREPGCFAIAMEPVWAGEYTLLEELAQGNTLANAVARAYEAQPDFELASRLRHHVESGTLVDFSCAH